MDTNVKYLLYLIASVFFYIGLKKLSSPKTARHGNLYAALGMLLAIVVTLYSEKILDWTWIILGMAIGAIIGAIVARKVKMTAMPQMVALFNGFGGIASALVAFSEYWIKYATASAQPDVLVTIMLSLLIGMVTFTGSLIAFAKLQGIMRGAPIVFKMQQLSNVFLLLAIMGIGIVAFYYDHSTMSFFSEVGISKVYLLLAIATLASVLGITSVIPIGGADMPVVIALLNSYSGLAAAATGFVLSNTVLIISGSLVGASGIILTKIMCNAMNRSLGNVLFGAVGSDGGPASEASGESRSVIRYTSEDVVVRLDSAQSIIIVPGYGLAAAQAQHALQQMVDLLTARGIQVRYAIHPVAGRMPGHMNVLLAEANVSYDLLYEMDAINEDFQNTDIAMVIGANDVVNPAARYDKNSALYGMPILNVDQARAVMIFKRSLNVGFAGEGNELFYDDKTMMVFGDAKKSITEIINILKEQ